MNKRESENGASQKNIIPRNRAKFFWFAQIILWIALNISANGAPRNERFVPGRILIKPRAGLSESNSVALLNREGTPHRGTLHHRSVHAITVSEDKLESVLTALRNDPNIEFAERDYIAQAAYVPNDTYVGSGNEWHLARIQALQAWDITTGRSNVVVAVLDSGVDAAHADLIGRILPGYDFVSGDNDAADDFGHGTAVAGTIVAAGNNGIGVAGVVPGCKVLPVKVLDSEGFGSYSSIADGIKFAVDHGASIINLSVAGNSPSSTLQDAINYAWNHNVVVVAAAGNNANSTPQYPAACDHVVAVSATEPNDTLAHFSNYGSYVTMSAPGDNIWTTQNDANDPYGAWRGTSFASPIVAGIAALVASENPSLSNDQIVALLQQSADDMGSPGYDIAFGYGRVNALNAVVAASALPGALPPQPPPPPTATTQTDTIPPAVTITQAPASGARLYSPQVSLAGTAEDNAGVQGVELRVNGTTHRAAGTTNWNAQITLSPGANTVRVHSVDWAGNVSPVITQTFTCIATLPLTVQTSGSGEVTPNLNGKRLEIGKAYTVKAVPAAGQAFAGWTGMSSDAPTLNFVMQSNLTLVANFVASPFPVVKGSYAGLAVGTNGITPESSGYFTLTVTPSGAFTGKLLLGGNRSPFRGQFNLDGYAVVTVNRAQLGPLTVTLHVDLASGTDQVAGFVTDGTWTSSLAGDRNVFNSQLNPAVQAGARSLILENTDDNAAVVATGSSKINSSGAIGIRGKLTDGRAFNARSTLAKNGDSPFYLSLSGGSEVVIGWMNFSAGPAPVASGTLQWVRNGTNALATTLRATSAP